MGRHMWGFDDTDREATLTVPGALVHQVGAGGDEEAVVDGDTRLTWAELGDHVSRAAAGLVTQGVERGDRVAIWGPNSWRWMVAALATTSLGAALVPVSSRNVGPEVLQMLDRAEVSVLLLEREMLGRGFLAELRAASEESGTPIALNAIIHLDVAGGSDDAMDWGEFIAAGAGVSDDDVGERARQVEPGDVADIVFTSGTTGRPKGVLASHEQDLFTFRAWSDRVGLREGDRYLLVNPLSHSFGYKAGLLACILRGATVVSVPTFDVPQVLDLLGRERITVMPGPPALFRSLLQHPDREGPLDSLRMAVTGAADIPVHLITSMRDDLGIPEVLTAYGLSESTGTVSVSRLGDDPETIATRCGLPIDQVEVRTVDTDGNDVGPDEPGEVVVRGPNVMLGYLDDPEATAEAIDDDGWLHTGDIGELDERGYLKITDRLKHMLTVGGFNVYPAEVEAVISSRPDVADVAIVGEDDDRLGQVPVAYVQLTEGSTLDQDEFRTWCRERLANYKVPRRVEILDELPRSALGKILKHQL